MLPQSRFGDTYLDGDVDERDFESLASNFGTARAGWSMGDFDADRDVDFSDFVVVTSLGSSVRYEFGVER